MKIKVFEKVTLINKMLCYVHRTLNWKAEFGRRACPTLKNFLNPSLYLFFKLINLGNGDTNHKYFSGSHMLEEYKIISKVVLLLLFKIYLSAQKQKISKKWETRQFAKNLLKFNSLNEKLVSFTHLPKTRFKGYSTWSYSISMKLLKNFY